MNRLHFMEKMSALDGEWVVIGKATYHYLKDRSVGLQFSKRLHPFCKGTQLSWGFTCDEVPANLLARCAVALARLDGRSIVRNLYDLGPGERCEYIVYACKLPLDQVACIPILEALR